LIFVFKIWHIIIASALAKDGLTTYTVKLHFVLMACVFSFLSRDKISTWWKKNRLAYCCFQRCRRKSSSTSDDIKGNFLQCCSRPEDTEGQCNNTRGARRGLFSCCLKSENTENQDGRRDKQEVAHKLMAANAAGGDAELTDREARGSSVDHDGEFVDAEEGHPEVEKATVSSQCTVI
jgi:hypothetical protein